MRPGLRIVSMAMATLGVLLPASAGADDWTPTVPGLAPAASDLGPFAAAGSGVLYLGRFSSLDGGRTWRQRIGPRPSLSDELIVDPADPLHARIFGFPAGAETHDGGVTWTSVELPGCNATSAGHVDTRALLVDRAVPGRVYRSETSDNGHGTTIHTLCRSDDAGGHWTLLPSPEGAPVLQPATGAASVLTALSPRGQLLARSLDGGATYALTPTDLPAQSYVGLWTEPAHPGRLYAYHQLRHRQLDVFQSDDGAHWSAIPTPAHFLRRWLPAPGRPGVVLTADAGWLWRSTDGGADWSHAFPLGNGGQVAEDAGGTLYVASAERVSRSVDGGATFDSSPLAVAGGPPIGITPALSDDGSGGVVAAGDWQIATFDAAAGRWSTPVQLHGCSPLGLLGIAPGTFLCLDERPTPHLSRDYGRTWVTAREPSCRRGRTVTASRVAVRASRTLYMAVLCDAKSPRQLLFRSDDVGLHWRLAGPLNGAFAPRPYGIVATAGGALLGVHPGHPRSLVRSRNGGRTWTRVAQVASSIDVIDATAAATFLQNGDTRVVTLTPGGQVLPGPPERDPQLLLRAGHPSSAVVVGWVADAAGVRRGSISLTRDAGRTWSQVGLPPTMAACLVGDAALDRDGRLLVTFRSADELAAPSDSCGSGVVWLSPPLV